MNNVPFRRWSGRLAAAAAAMALAAGFTAAPATANPVTANAPAPVYIALGDSYAAGTGGGDYLVSPAAPQQCLQTAAAYPVLRGAALNLGCFGAKTTDVAAAAGQFEPALKTATVVTVTVGGNDVDTGQVAVACTLAPSSPECSAALYNTLVVKLRELPGKIKAMLTTIKNKAPNARIVLTGYPRLFTISAALTTQQVQAAKTMNSAADLLNATIAYSALVNRVRYVSVTERFTGHGIGSGDPWIVAPCNPLAPCARPLDAFHPTAAGYSGGYDAALEAARVP
ncbi:SGNH/GDSL hydrolase family protein [Arthrobacter sp. ok362]|jgi:lysophospholipase L1-like esterase|uniref:SGNH/GDSL hydrolase family protein n=1 Tax=Arthrobacter sp. ok362 TaxID=1761745 RepID=UPI00087E1DF5|nr:SGNH/GDSL hydrolase family protein [Arthrobacter sp. ok362]SDK65481.1 GDSL-like Lipase/Acylhydrolase family protein [Arthrobacter sp. ok362]